MFFCVTVLSEFVNIFSISGVYNFMMVHLAAGLFFNHSLGWDMVNPFNTETCVLQLGVFSCIQSFYRNSGKIKERKWNMEFFQVDIKCPGLVF